MKIHKNGIIKILSIESKTLNNNVLKVGVGSYKMNYDSKYDYLSVST